MSDCKWCEGSGWVNAAGFKTIPTTETDPHRLPCGSCRPMIVQEPPRADDTLRAESEARMKHFAWVERHSEAVLEVCKRQTDAMVRIADALEKLSNATGWPR